MLLKHRLTEIVFVVKQETPHEILHRKRILLKRRMGNGKWEMENLKWEWET